MIRFIDPTTGREAETCHECGSIVSAGKCTNCDATVKHAARLSEERLEVYIDMGRGEAFAMATELLELRAFVRVVLAFPDDGLRYAIAYWAGKRNPKLKALMAAIAAERERARKETP